MYNKDSISLLIAGDYHPTEILTEFIKNGKCAPDVFGDLLPLIKSSDLAIAQLEIPVTERNEKMPKGGSYGKTDALCLRLLEETGFKLCTFASNHTLDFGHEGCLDTLAACKKLGLSVVGAGINSADARQPYIAEINKIVFAVLNYTETEFNIASYDSPGANPLDLINVYNDIQNLKSKVDHIIVIIHGGQDFIFHPSPRLVKVYRFIAEQNVSAVIGHHTHYISSFEIHNGVPIIYSLGHLIYYYNESDVFTRLFNIAFLTLTKETCKLELLPFHFDSEINRIGVPNKELLYMLQIKQSELNESIKNDFILYSKWFEEISNEDSIRNLHLISGYPLIIFRLFKKLKLLRLLKRILLIRRKKYLPIWNISRCPHHNAAMDHLFNSIFLQKER